MQLCARPIRNWVTMSCLPVSICWDPCAQAGVAAHSLPTAAQATPGLLQLEGAGH